MRLQSKGLIIKEKAVGENDRLVVVLTEERGLITAFANGARKIKSKNASSTSLLCYSDFNFFNNKGTYSINEASVINVFFDIRQDIDMLALAQYFCEINLSLAPENEAAEEYLRLILNALHFLIKGSKSPAMLKAVLEIRTLSLSGYQPDLIGCSGCGEYEDALYFDAAEGRLICADCLATSPEAIHEAVPISGTVLAAMRHIVYSEFDKIFSFTVPDTAQKELSEIAERYLLLQTDRRYKTLEFYHSLERI